MKRKLLIKGKRVQDIGYRMFLLNLASEHGLTGFQAYNLNKDKVEALYEGDEESVRAFESDVRVMMPEGAEVEEMSFEDYNGPVMDIERFRSNFTTLQLGKMIEIGVMMLRNQDKMLKNQELMIQKLDTISQKQDETLNELRAFREENRRNQELMIQKLDTISQKQDAMLEKQDAMLEKQDETINELRGMRKDLRAFMDERLAKLERDLMTIKERLGIA